MLYSFQSFLIVEKKSVGRPSRILDYFSNFWISDMQISNSSGFLFKSLIFHADFIWTGEYRLANISSWIQATSKTISNIILFVTNKMAFFVRRFALPLDMTISKKTRRNLPIAHLHSQNNPKWNNYSFCEQTKFREGQEEIQKLSLLWEQTIMPVKIVATFFTVVKNLHFVVERNGLKIVRQIFHQ